jgi:hypothetical protein
MASRHSLAAGSIARAVPLASFPGFLTAAVCGAGVCAAGHGASAPVPYHPASQYWPLQLILLTILLALAVAAMATGWHATRTRTV